MKDVLDRAPHLHNKVHKLLDEHGHMSKQVNELVAVAAGLHPDQPPPAAFRHRTRQLLQEIRRHEASENRFVQETANQELGTDD